MSLAFKYLLHLLGVSATVCAADFLPPLGKMVLREIITLQLVSSLNLVRAIHFGVVLFAWPSFFLLHLSLHNGAPSRVFFCCANIMALDTFVGILSWATSSVTFLTLHVTPFPSGGFVSVRLQSAVWCFSIRPPTLLLASRWQFVPKILNRLFDVVTAYSARFLPTTSGYIVTCVSKLHVNTRK